MIRMDDKEGLSSVTWVEEEDGLKEEELLLGGSEGGKLTAEEHQVPMEATRQTQCLHVVTRETVERVEDCMGGGWL